MLCFFKTAIQALVLFTITLSLSSTVFADQLIIEPDMGRAPIENFIQQAHQSIYLVMYGFTDEAILASLLKKKHQGQTIKIILERRPFRAENENLKTIQALDLNHIDWHGEIPSMRLIHQKTLIIDGRAAAVMTFNFTRSTFKHERNFGLIIDDPLEVREIQTIFTSDWNSKPTRHDGNSLIYSPDNSREALTNLISAGKRNIKVYAQSVNDYKMIGALAKAAERGVKVQILTSASLRSKQINYLRKAGVEVHHCDQYYIHAKVFIIDDQKALIGSINLTRQSLDDNRELSVLTHEPKIIKQLSFTFNSDWSESSATTDREENLYTTNHYRSDNHHYARFLHQFAKKTYHYLKKAY